MLSVIRSFRLQSHVILGFLHPVLKIYQSQIAKYRHFHKIFFIDSSTEYIKMLRLFEIVEEKMQLQKMQIE